MAQFLKIINICSHSGPAPSGFEAKMNLITARLGGRPGGRPVLPVSGQPGQFKSGSSGSGQFRMDPADRLA
jgi:hypothetical protein